MKYVHELTTQEGTRSPTKLIIAIRAGQYIIKRAWFIQLN